MIIGILGLSGTGKDAATNFIIEHGAQRIGFADALKRTCIEIFDFEPHQVWGSQAEKEAPDLRYPREHTWSYYDAAGGGINAKCICCGVYGSDPDRNPCHLTGRYALQIIGTEGARHCWNNIWVKKALDVAELIQRGFLYNRELGIEDSNVGSYPRIAVFTDCRFINEINAVQSAGGRVYRIKRPGYEKPQFNHASETEQLQVPDDRLQGVILNDGTLEDLKEKVLNIVRYHGSNV